MLRTEFDKTAQVALSRPVKLTFHFLVVYPEDVRGHNLYAARLHFQNFFFPTPLGVTRIMELPHHGKPGRSVLDQIAAVRRKHMSVRRPSTNCKGDSFSGSERMACVNKQRWITVLAKSSGGRRE